MHAQTTIVEILGQVDIYPWIQADSLGEDAYSLFMARSTAMGWAHAGVRTESHAAWGMNDAGFGLALQQRLVSEDLGSGEGEGDFVARAQVSVSAPATAVSLMAVAECLRSTIERVGVLRFEGLRASATAWPEGRDRGTSTLISCLNWFEVVEPLANRSVAARLKAVPGSPDIDFSALLATLRRLNTGPFRFDGNGVELTVTVPEWSVAAAAWAASLLAHESGIFNAKSPSLASIEVVAEATQ